MACSIAPPPTDHERLRLGLMSAGLKMFAAQERPEEFPQAHEQLVNFCLTQLLPHLEQDDRWLRKASRCPEGHLLADAMRAEARMMKAAVYELADTTAACEAMAHTRVLHSFLAAHDHHEKLLHHADSAS